MFKKNLEYAFIVIIVLSITVLLKNYYDDYVFKNSPLPDKARQQIIEKEREILSLMKEKYGVSFKVPIIITDKIESKLYGVTSYDNGDIKIYLNKKIMKESMEYMVENVIAHEYAHAVMFRYGLHKNKNDAHGDKWQEICQNLGGKKCQRYVNNNDVIMGKMPF